VAASGPDVAYPRRHARLWREVTGRGAIISENLPGRPAQAWRFPTRNRIIAGLVSLVVVVESHRGGGSLITAEAAIERGVEVRVVPGPVHSPASEGSNQLLYDGPGPVRHAQDVLDALGDFRPDSGAARRGPAPPPAAARPSPDTDGGRVLDAVGWRPASTGQIMARTGLDAATVARCLDRLTAAGLVATESGWWSRRT
jgi:DNA processing protein